MRTIENIISTWYERGMNENKIAVIGIEAAPTDSFFVVRVNGQSITVARSFLLAHEYLHVIRDSFKIMGIQTEIAEGSAIK